MREGKVKGIAGLVLAGGHSSRMQQDKALLNIDGVSLLDRQCDLLSALLGTDNVFVSGDRSNYRCILDDQVSRGPLEGIRSACLFLKKTEIYQGLLVVPVDMPLLKMQNLVQLVQSAKNSEAIKFKGQQFPILFSNIENILLKISDVKKANLINKRIKFSLFELFNVLLVSDIEPISQDGFENVNTPEDWDFVQSKLRSI